jgi:hypothetical protein
VLASGILVDRDTGAPVQGRVRLVMSADEGRWEWARNFDTGVDGRFELRGPPPRGAVGVQAFAFGYEGAWTQRVGRDLVLRLEREGARLTLEVRLDAGIPRSWLEIVLVDPEGDELVGSLREESLVVFQECRAREYTLEARTSAGGWVVERRTGLLVLGYADGSVRLTLGGDDPMDLTGRLAMAALALVDDSGAPLADVPVDARIEPWGRGRVPVRTDGAGRLTLLVPSGCPEIELAPEGFTPLAFGWLPGEQVLTFSRP